MDLTDEFTELTYGKGFENPLRAPSEELCREWSGVVLSCLGPMIAPHLLTPELFSRLEVMKKKASESRPAHEMPIIRALSESSQKRGVE